MLINMSFDQEHPLFPFVKLLADVDSNAQRLRLEVARLQDLNAGAQTELSETATERDLYKSQVIPDWRLQANKVLAICETFIFLQIPYQFGAEYRNNKAMDCSSFAEDAFSIAGIDIARSSKYQALNGEQLDYADIGIADLVFFDTNKDGVINHVGIADGQGYMYHTNSTKELPRREIIEGKWRGVYVTARRVIKR